MDGYEDAIIPGSFVFPMEIDDSDGSSIIEELGLPFWEEDAHELASELSNPRKRSAEDALQAPWSGDKCHKSSQGKQSLLAPIESVSFEDLPLEVWVNIVTHLNQMQDLAAVAQTSSHLNGAVLKLKFNPRNLCAFLSEIAASGPQKNNLIRAFVSDHNLLSVNGCALFFHNYDSSMPLLAKQLRGALDSSYIHLRNGLINADPNITDLDCSDLKVKILPPQIFFLKNLRTLILTNNSLVILPKSIGNLENLQELHLDRNKLKTIPPEVAKLNQLSYLDLSHTQLRSIPDEVLNGRMIENFHTHQTPYSYEMTINDMRSWFG